MIDVYTWPTPNGRKVSIALEEFGLPYEVRPVNIGAGEQDAPEFRAISPNGKIPAIIDRSNGISLMESGAILMYLASKSGRLMSSGGSLYWRQLEWLMFQMGGVGPMLGQNHHFRVYAPEKIQYAVDRYTNEAARLYRVIDAQLAASEYLAGDDYTIADMATFPWLRGHERQGQDLDDTPNLKRWFEAVEARPAVQAGCRMLTDLRKEGPISDKAREMMFGAAQYAKR